MALSRARATDVVILLGVGEPYEYDAGTFEADGRTIKFDAGVSRRICVGTLDGTNFYVMKIKTANEGRLRGFLDSLDRGVTVVIEHTSVRGQYECHDVRLATEDEIAAASNGRATAGARKG